MSAPRVARCRTTSLAQQRVEGMAKESTAGFRKRDVLLRTGGGRRGGRCEEVNGNQDETGPRAFSGVLSGGCQAVD